MAKTPYHRNRRVNIICTMQFALTPFWFSLYYAISFIQLALMLIMLFVLLFLIHTICTKLAHAICPMDIFVFKLHCYCWFIQFALMLNLYIYIALKTWLWYIYIVCTKIWIYFALHLIMQFVLQLYSYVFCTIAFHVVCTTDFLSYFLY